MERMYRIELERNGRSVLYGYFFTTLEKIIKALEGNLKSHPRVNVYSKTGKVLRASFRG